MPLNGRDISVLTDSEFQAVQDVPETGSGAAPFQFAISWRSLTQSKRPATAQPSGRGLSVERALALENRTNRFETVQPLVNLPGRTAPPSEQPAALLSAPSFTPALDTSSLRKRVAVAGIALVMVTIGLAAFRRTDKPSPAPEQAPVQTMEMGGTGWISEWVTDRIGSAQGRQISLYRPSVLMSDYRVEFNGQIERKSLGWVFRVADPRNYQVAKLQASRPGAPLTLVRFAVVQGVEDPHVSVKLPSVSGSGMLKVKLDANRSRFTIYVQNKVVEDWQDDRLKTGGIGFLNERDERGQVESVEVSFQKAGVSK